MEAGLATVYRRLAIELESALALQEHAKSLLRCSLLLQSTNPHPAESFRNIATLSPLPRHDPIA